MVQAVDRAIIILDILEKNSLVSLTNIAKQLGVNKSTAYRLLATLEAKRLVGKDELTKRYKLGLGLLKYSNKLLSGMQITRISSKYMEELVNKTQESAHLCVLSKNKAVFVDQKKSPEIISISTQIGDEEPVHCSAVGKNLIAFLPKNELLEILDNIEFKSYTHRTITSKQILLPHLEKIREQGYAIDDEEVNEGVRCVAAPIKNHESKVIAAIGVSGPASRIQLGNIQKYVDAVKDTADEFSSKLGYSISKDF